MDKEFLLEQISKQKENFSKSPLLNAEYRVKKLKTLYKNIKLMEKEIANALWQDLNKSSVEAYMSEIGIVLSEISYMIKHCKKFAKAKKVRTPIAQFHSKSYKLPSPYGVVFIISPWNYPFMLSMDPLVDAIAAGNSVVLKPSQTSKNVAQVIDKLIKMTFDESEVITVMGRREETGFLLDEQFDYIFFTGSTRVGKMIMEKAARNFTPVTLELGGKSPCIVDESANIPLAARRIVFGKFLNCGQTCVAPDYIYCHESVKENLVSELKKQIVLQYSVDPIHNETYPKMINERQFNEKIKLIDSKKVVFGGKTDEKLLKIEPTIIDASFEDEIMKEEIFAPILPIVTFKNIDEVVERVNGGNKPLALYIFSSSKKNIDKVANLCQFGGGCINDTIVHIASSNLAFGGVKESGVGCYHGKAGFDTFSHYKSIVDKKTWIDLPMRYQPHGKKKEKLIRMFLK